jgi:hypothetical protein
VQATIAMYVGLVRGSGRQDLPGASCAFRAALEWEPSIELDAELATPPVKAAFEREAASLAKTQPTPTP